MLKDMWKFANKEIINLWISFVFLKTPCPTLMYQYKKLAFLFIMTRNGTNVQHWCIKPPAVMPAQNGGAAFFSNNERNTINRVQALSPCTLSKWHKNKYNISSPSVCMDS